MLLLLTGVVAQDADYMQIRDGHWYTEVAPDALNTPIGVLDSQDVVGPERVYNKTTGEYYYWQPATQSWATMTQIAASSPEAVQQQVDAADAFGRVRISEAASLFDGQFTYDSQPLLFGNYSSANASVDHDNTNKMMTLSLSSAAADTAYIQTYRWFRYQPGKSQLIFITFNMNGGVADVEKMVGYTDGVKNGYEFAIDSTVAKFRLRSSTTQGTVEAEQANWNRDVFDGTGASGITIDWTKTHILVIDFEALYVGRIRFGFNIDGITYWAHEFNNANTSDYPYIQNANLPVRASIISSGSGITTDMDLVCTSVMSEAGQEENYAYEFTTAASATATNGSDVHVISITPRDSFANDENRGTYILEKVIVLNEGTADVLYKVCLGQAITTPTVAAVNETYSGMEQHTGGTLSGTPAIVFDQAYVVGGTNQTGNRDLSSTFNLKYPITRDIDNSLRDLGKVTILAQGIGGDSDIEVVLQWREIR